MPRVLTTQSTVACGHQGVVQVQSTATLRVAGASVLQHSGIEDKPVNALCQIVVPSSGNKKCTKVSSISNGSTTKLIVDGKPVILETLAGGTDGTVGSTPQKLLSGVANQDKLRSL